MRPYDREGFRHLTDSERYRDIDYLADDAYVGPNERLAYGMTRDDLPPWSTYGDWETRAFAGQRSWDEDRGQGRQYGADMGLGYGRPYDESTIERSRNDPYERRADLPQDRPHPLRHAYDHRGDWTGHAIGRGGVYTDRGPTSGREEEQERSRFGAIGGIASEVAANLRGPGQLLEKAKGLFRGKGPKNWSRSDERIRDEVCERLSMSPDVDASDIEVNVKDGEVTLFGEVEDRRLRYLVEDIAGDVLGVHDVHNRLRIRGSVGTTTATRTESVGGANVSSHGGARR